MLIRSRLAGKRPRINNVSNLLHTRSLEFDRLRDRALRSLGSHKREPVDPEYQPGNIDTGIRKQV